ncbi:MAG: ATP-dependent DNA helicase [Thermodesulfobacteriota bacterium]
MPQWIDKTAATAWKYVNSTNRNIFLTGRAGTGKTTFLQDIRRHTHKNTVVTAPTGIAAINAEGATLHSFFQLPFGAFLPQEQSPREEAPDFEFYTPYKLKENLKMHSNKLNLIRKLELLIIDEVSMLRADILDAIDTVLRWVRKCPQTPFGGVQILFIGDLFQLPPVVKKPEWELLADYYQTMFFFGARAFEQQIPLYIELEHIYRQNDPEFITLLNHLRDGQLTPEDIELLNMHYKPEFLSQATEEEDTGGTDSEEFVYLTTHNNFVDSINRQKLHKLPGETFQYKAAVKDKFEPRHYPVDEILELKENSQVMFVKNDPSGEQRFFNGKIGTVEQLQKNGIKVQFSDGTPPVWVEAYTWENKQYILNREKNTIEEKVIGTFTQYPLRLAWAITIHKSQGLTFENAIIDVSRAFAAGQVYVALSRLTSLQGLVLTSPLPGEDLPREPALEDFTRRKQDTASLEWSLQNDSLDYLKETLRDAFDLQELGSRIKKHAQTYTMDPDRSRKQGYADWADSLLHDLELARKEGDEFLEEIQGIIPYSLKDNFTQLLHKVKGAKEYFEAVLLQLSNRISTHLAELKTQEQEDYPEHTPKSGAGLKEYMQEIRELEPLFHTQVQKVYKTLALVESFHKNKELTKSDIGSLLSRRPVVEKSRIKGSMDRVD